MPQEIDRDSPSADVGPSATRARDPRVALSFSYAAMFGHLGIVLPFLAPWIRSRGYGPAVIGLLMALPPLAKVVAPWGWGRWADRSGRRREVLIVAGLVASAALAAMVFAETLYALALLMAVYGFMRSPILPYLEATGSGVLKLAYGCGRSVIASRVGSLGDEVVDGKTGLLVRPGDAGELADALIRFYREDLRDTLETGVLQQRRQFSWQAAVSALQRLSRHPPVRDGRP